MHIKPPQERERERQTEKEKEREGGETSRARANEEKKKRRAAWGRRKGRAKPRNHHAWGGERKASKQGRAATSGMPLRKHHNGLT